MEQYNKDDNYIVIPVSEESLEENRLSQTIDSIKSKCEIILACCLKQQDYEKIIKVYKNIKCIKIEKLEMSVIFKELVEKYLSKNGYLFIWPGILMNCNIDAEIKKCENSDSGIVGAMVLDYKTRKIYHSGIIFPKSKPVERIHEGLPENNLPANEIRNYSAVDGNVIYIDSEIIKNIEFTNFKGQLGFYNYCLSLIVKGKGSVEYIPTLKGLMFYDAIGDGYTVKQVNFVFNSFKDYLSNINERK